jgi:hypothetical protein
MTHVLKLLVLGIAALMYTAMIVCICISLSSAFESDIHSHAGLISHALLPPHFAHVSAAYLLPNCTMPDRVITHCALVLVYHYIGSAIY